jgi:hypothetical protein
MIVQNREGRLFAGGVDTGLPFQKGWISKDAYARLFIATGGDRASLAIAMSVERAVYRCQCGAFFVGQRSRQWRRLKCDDCAKTAEAMRRRRALDRRSEKRGEARQGKRCEQCGKPIEAKRSTRRFCSGLCRVRAHRVFA